MLLFVRAPLHTDKSKPTASLPTDTSHAVVRPCSPAHRQKQAHCKPANRHIACCCSSVLPCTQTKASPLQACQQTHRMLLLVRAPLHTKASPLQACQQTHCMLLLVRAPLHTDKSKPTASLPTDTSHAVARPCSPAHGQARAASTPIVESKLKHAQLHRKRSSACRHLSCGTRSCLLTETPRPELAGAGRSACHMRFPPSSEARPTRDAYKEPIMHIRNPS